MFTGELADLFAEDIGGVPDLFVYKPDLSEWFVAEIKGNKDSIGDRQIEWAKRFKALTGRTVMMVDVRQT